MTKIEVNKKDIVIIKCYVCSKTLILPCVYINGKPVCLKCKHKVKTLAFELVENQEQILNKIAS
jgi:hypothetical protein